MQLIDVQVTRQIAGGVCGGPLTDWIVPDKPLGYDFTGACQAHDDCRANPAVSAQTCHNEFALDLRIACEGDSLCNLIADVYVWAVETFDTDAASEWSDWGDSSADMGGGGGVGEGGGGGGGGYAYFEEQEEEAEST